MKFDATERSLESVIVHSLINEASYVQGDSKDYNQEHAFDLAELSAFRQATQSGKLKM